jgi:hypothetical protein
MKMKQLNSDRPKAMDKETFMQQYVLNRAKVIDDMDGEGSAIQAKKAWNELIKSEGAK